MGQNEFAALLHKPLGSGGGSTDSYRFGSFQNLEVYILTALNQIGFWVYVEAFVEQHPAVGTLAARYKENDIVPAGKLTYVLAAV